VNFVNYGKESEDFEEMKLMEIERQWYTILYASKFSATLL
jgi:hypothetical protein